MGIFSDVQGQQTPQSVVNQSEIQTHRSNVHVIVTCNYEKERMKSSREKVETLFFSSLPYLLPWKPVLGSGQISNSSKLSCMLSLPASMKRIRLRTLPRKSGDIIFPIISLWGFFSDFQGQLTLQWVVQSSQNLNSSELSCMSSLPASMIRIR